MFKASIYLNEEQIVKILKLVVEHGEVKLSIYETLGVQSFMKVETLNESLQLIEQGGNDHDDS